MVSAVLISPIDFIDMQSEDHKSLVLNALERTLEKCHAKTKITEVSSFCHPHNHQYLHQLSS
jgi:Ribonuclease G/E